MTIYENFDKKVAFYTIKQILWNATHLSSLSYILGNRTK